MATSVVVRRPVAFLTSVSQGRAISPRPSKLLGRVRGFQMPARKILTAGISFKASAVVITCSNDSAEHGPAMTSGPFDEL